MLEEEAEQKIKEKEDALAERIPPLNMSGLSLQELQVFYFIKSFSSFSLTNLLISILVYYHVLIIFLQDICKDLHHKIDVVDEEWYDIGLKVNKNQKEVSCSSLGRKIKLCTWTYF